MGVAGLWDVLRPAGAVRSLTDLAIREGFEANPDGKRGFRLGIDASIWFFHAEYGREGENPVLRTLFFRCATLMHTTFLPIFVFDGPKRPDWKRGKKINKTSHKLIPGMKQIVEAFGFEWRMAPGEAEAELAYLNRIGIIDGILSDDVDNFLFGATTVIRNSSNTLSGNRSNPILNSAGKDDKNHTRIFTQKDITAHPEIRLTRGGMILIGLMSGGDYQEGGLARCGVTTAHGLAKCGFGDSLYDAAVNLDRDDLEEFLVVWRHELRQELRTNSKKEVGRKQVALANSIPEDFPNIDILLSYVKPITSESMGRAINNLHLTWSKEPDVAKLASVCEFYFEWGYKEAIIKRFRTVMWHSIVLRILRRAVLDQGNGESKMNPPTTPRKNGKEQDRSECGTPSKMIAKHFSSLDISTTSKIYISGSESDEEDDALRLIIKVHGFREHASTDGLPEYRLEIAPRQLVELAESGVQGIRTPEGPDEWASEEGEDDDGEGKKSGKKEPIDPETHLRVWMPACMVKMVEPALVQEYEDIQQQKKLKKLKKGTRKTTTKDKAGAKERAPRKKKVSPVVGSDDESLDVFSAPATEKAKKKAKASRTSSSYPEEGSSEQEHTAIQVDEPPPLPKINEKLAAIRKPLLSILSPLSSEAEEEPYEYGMRLQPLNATTYTKSNNDALESDRLPSGHSISSPVKSRAGVRDLTKKKPPLVNATHGMKSFFPVTMNIAKKASTLKAPPSKPSSTARAVLDHLEAAHPSIRTDSSSSSVLQKKPAKKTLSQLPSAYHRSDSSDGEYNIALWDKNRKAGSQVSPASKRKMREKNPTSMSESEPTDRVKKSPRKKVSHSSPQAGRRPVSPSPSSARTVKKYPNVIEITSGSDLEDSLPRWNMPKKKTIPPLMMARARSSASTTTSSSSSQLPSSLKYKTQRKPTYATSSDIIDLT